MPSEGGKLRNSQATDSLVYYMKTLLFARFICFRWEVNSWQSKEAAAENTMRAPVDQLVEHRAVMRKVVTSTPAGPTLRAGLKITEE